jgi:transcriptional regulator with XRE-family HTH domain
MSISRTTAERVGRTIHDLRVERHVTGVELAQMAGMSQSRISKIENGYPGSIDSVQIGVLLDILKSPKTIRQQLSLLLYQLKDSEIPFAHPFADFPEELNSLQETTTEFRSYVSSGISAVLQTSEYRVAYLSRAGIPDKEARAEMSKTIKRQDALWDASKRWSIVMPEQALYTMPADFRVQIAQLDRLERMIGVKNVRIGIIPLQAGTSFFETGSFSFYDDKVLFVRMGDRTARIDDPAVLIKFLSAFDELMNLSFFDGEAIMLIRKAVDYFASGH